MAKQDETSRSVRLSSVLSETQWHSSLSFDSVSTAGQKSKKVLKNTRKNRNLFIPAGCFLTSKFASNKFVGQAGELLIHKSDRALWRISNDGKKIEPAFSDDIITIGEDEHE